MPNFIKIGQSVANILRFFFDFSRWRPPPFCIFEIAKFYSLLGWRWSKRISAPNFVEISHGYEDITFFSIF